MTQVKVLMEFYDKHDHSRLYKPGEVVSFEDGRAADIVTRRLGELVSDVAEEQPKPKKKSAKKPS